MEQFCFHFGLDRVMVSRQEKYTKVNITLKKKKKGKIKQKKKPMFYNSLSNSQEAKNTAFYLLKKILIYVGYILHLLNKTVDTFDTLTF